VSLTDIIDGTKKALLVASALTLATVYSSYSARPDYVHQPHWLRVEQAALRPGLYGVATPANPLAIVRSDLSGMDHSEVRLHETMHNLYPSCTEDEVRQHVRARFGSKARIHTYLCPPRNVQTTERI